MDKGTLPRTSKMITSAGEAVEKGEPSDTTAGDIKYSSHSGKEGQILVELNLAAQHSNSTPGFHTGRMKTSVHTKTCVHTFTAALTVIALSWKPKCPSTGWWINTAW